MNKDRIEGKVKDVAGRAERQGGEWTGDVKKQVQGAGKQVEGKLQNTWGKVKDAVDNRKVSTEPNASEADDETADVTDRASTRGKGGR